MKEFLALIIVVFISGVIYWGVEPFAHSQLYPHVEPADYTFKDLAPVAVNGDASAGKDAFATCVACHAFNGANVPEADRVPAMMSDADYIATYGVVPPDLSTAGAIYEKNFLINVIKDAATATKQTHKFDGTHAMAPGLADDESAANIVAYLQSIAPAALENKAIFLDACGRCHDMKYDKQFSSLSGQAYLGTKVPDLSMMIRSRALDYLHNFINDPQKMLPGTTMPRVGLTEVAETQVIAYMESVGDSKKAERESLGLKLVIFMLILGGVAYLWKKKIWAGAH